MTVKAGRVYRYQPSGWDLYDSKNAPKIAAGVYVKVMSKSPQGCPKQGTMGHWFIQNMSGEFIGLVSAASLHRMEG